MERPHVLVNPAPDALATLEREHGIPAALLQHALDQDELPRMEHEGDTTLVILRAPARNPDRAGPPYITVPVALLVRAGRSFIVSPSATDVTTRLHSGADAAEAADRLLPRLIMRVAESFLVDLRELTRDLDALEDRLPRALGNDEVLALLRHQKSLVYFTTALRENEILAERFQRAGSAAHVPVDPELMEDALVELRQASAVTSITAENLSNTMDAFTSLISNNLNVVMKVLTVLTIILSVPTLVASLYGMNVALPGAGTPWAFGVVTLGSVAAGGGVAWVMRRRGWL